MNSTKRILKPVRLAIPTLLALSATAAWSPTESYAGTGFSAIATTSSSATLEAKYDRPNVFLDIWSHAQWRNSSTHQWSDLAGGGALTLWTHVDFLDPIWTGITKPPVDDAVDWIWDDNNPGANYALAQVSDL